MVRLKLLTSRAGDGFTQAYGSTVEVEVDEAQRLLAVNQAELLPGKEGADATAALAAYAKKAPAEKTASEAEAPPAPTPKKPRGGKKQ